MDLIYLPESIAYQSRMSMYYGREDQSWININEKPVKYVKEKQSCTKDEKNCSICKSRQKRGLSTYIRKARRDSERDGVITEEAEDEEEGQGNESCLSTQRTSVRNGGQSAK